jgi:Helix-turn-helix domain
MLGHGAKFDHKKEQAIAALLSHRNTEEAARAVGISSNTLQRWLKEPEFDAAYTEARQAASRESIARLQSALGAAVTTVLKTMVDPNASAGTRLRAAAIVLDQATKAIEIERIDDRLTKLERSAKSVNDSRKRFATLPSLRADALLEPATRPTLLSATPRLLTASPAEINNDTDRLESTSASENHTPSTLEPSCEEPAGPTDRTTADDEVG